jgi:predicted RNase H-like nuclease
MKLCGCFDDVVSLRPKPEILAIDMPMGLLQNPVRGGRTCDQEARRLLGWPRRNSVFSPPSRPALALDSFDAANRHNEPAGLTKQAFALFPKLREVDAAMSPSLQSQFGEVHPEVCFYAANNNVPMQNKKKSRAGKQERLTLLHQIYGQRWDSWWKVAAGLFPRKQVALDDILDACIAAWTAERIHAKTAVRIPNAPPTDTHGLRMEIWY